MRMRAARRANKFGVKIRLHSTQVVRGVVVSTPDTGAAAAGGPRAGTLARRDEHAESAAPTAGSTGGLQTRSGRRHFPVQSHSLK